MRWRPRSGFIYGSELRQRPWWGGGTQKKFWQKQKIEERRGTKKKTQPFHFKFCRGGWGEGRIHAQKNLGMISYTDEPKGEFVELRGVEIWGRFGGGVILGGGHLRG